MLPAETLAGEWYHLTDPQFSTVSIIDSTAKVVERVDYNPYGHGSFHPPGDITGNGTVDVDDLLVINNRWGMYGPGDLNRDGTVNVDDQLIVINGWSTVPPTAGQISKTDNVFS